jgi:hypothetical protein
MDASKSRNAVKFRDGSGSRGNSIIMDGISRDNNIQHGHQQLTTKKLKNSSRDNWNITDINSRRETSNSKEARNCRDKPTVIASEAVLGILIRRIRMFLSLPDPDPYPLERVADPDPTPDPSLFS